MPPPPIHARDRTYSGGESAEYAHDHHQLAVALSGVLLIRNFSGTWTIPTGCAGWIPAGVRHRLEAVRTARARTLYVRREFVRRGRTECTTLQLTPLMRALIDHAGDAAAAVNDAAWRRLAAVIEDQLALQPSLPLFVPAITSALAKHVADTIARDPDDTPRTHEIAAALRVSARTVERAFANDVGMTFGEWRQRTRVCRAVALLADGGTVNEVAIESGYETTSAFITAFKRYAGTTPGRTKHVAPVTGRSSAGRSAAVARPSRSVIARAATRGRARRPR